MEGRYCGAKPKQAACKALTGIYKLYKKEETELEGEVKFGVRETTRNSRNKIYFYSGQRLLLDDPITLEIAEGKSITYKYNSIVKKAMEDDCKHLLDYKCAHDDDEEEVVAEPKAALPETITLIGKGGRRFEVSRKYANISKLVENALEGDQSATDIPVLGVNDDILQLIVNYMNEHKGTEEKIIEKPLRSKIMSEVTTQADATFIDTIGEKRQQLYDLILAANYMNIVGLLHLGCAKVASLIKGQPLEKIKEILQPEGAAAPVPAAAAEDHKEWTRTT